MGEREIKIVGRFWACFKFSLTGKQGNKIEVNVDYQVLHNELSFNLENIYPIIVYRWIRIYGKKSVPELLELSRILTTTNSYIKTIKRARIGNEYIEGMFFNMEQILNHDFIEALNAIQRKQNELLSRDWWLFFVKAMQLRKINFNNHYRFDDQHILFHFNSCYTEVFYLWNNKNFKRVPNKKIILQALKEQPFYIGEAKGFLSQSGNSMLHKIAIAELEVRIPKKYMSSKHIRS